MEKLDKVEGKIKHLYWLLANGQEIYEKQIRLRNPYFPRARLELELAFLERGFDVEQHEHGLLVNNKFIVAVKVKKWCNVGRYKWYYYKDIDALVNTYFKQEK